MTINRNNFEAYLLDYLEGNLDPLLTADLMAFLAENPEFEKYVPDFEIQPLTIQSGEFIDKQLLRKNFSDLPGITLENFDEFCIAFYEGLLSEKDSSRLEEYVAQHNEKQKDLDLFGSLKLQPDLSIAYSDKAGLKKPAGKSFRLRYLYYGLNIAASVSLILLLMLNRKSNDNTEVLSTLSMTNGATSGHPAGNQPEDDPLTGPPNSSLIESLAPVKQGTSYVEKNRHTGDTNLQRHVDAPQLQREDMQLAALEPIAPELTAARHRQEMLLPKTNHVLSDPELPRKRTRPEWIDSESLLGNLISRVNLWKTAETAIDGFNYLTEAQLSIAKTTDENGNTMGLVLNTESYSIETK